LPLKWSPDIRFEEAESWRRRRILEGARGWGEKVEEEGSLKEGFFSRYFGNEEYM